MVDGVRGYVDHVVTCDGTQQCSTSCDNPTDAVRIGDGKCFRIYFHSIATLEPYLQSVSMLFSP